MQTQEKYLTLTEAAKIAPARPSTNCMWRWCRKGVIARSGDRVRLDHVRMGGKIFTTARWVEEFGRRLAEADAAYFSLHNDDLQSASRRRPRTRDRTHAERLQQVEEELAREGL